MIDKNRDLSENAEYQFGTENQTTTPVDESPGVAVRLPTPPRKISKKFIVLAIIIGVMIIGYRLLPTESKPQPAERQTESPALQANLQGDIRLSSLEQKSAALEDKIATLQNGLNSLNNAIYNINLNLTKLNQDIQTLQQKSADGKEPAKIKTEYHVRAIIEGRAWLEKPNGTIITVRQGNKLGKYGTVTQIDEDKGMITTDKGVVVTYGLYDS